MHSLALTGYSRVIAAFIIGFFFGFILVRSKLAMRKTLIDQFSFKDNTFAITFLVSITVGVPIFYFTAKYNLIQLDFDNYKFWAVIIGAIITGLGIVFSGHLPCTAIASLGTGRLYSLFVLAGMLCAFPVLRMAYPILNDYVEKPDPMNVNAIAQNTLIYDGKTAMLYFIPILCLILAMFLRLIQPSGSSKKSKEES
jgi:hypothetical protein